jgi:hypothetical protein
VNHPSEPDNPADYGDPRWVNGNRDLDEAGYAFGLDVWDQVSKAYVNYLGDGGLANAQLWSLREAIRAQAAGESP